MNARRSRNVMPQAIGAVVAVALGLIVFASSASAQPPGFGPRPGGSNNPFPRFEPPTPPAPPAFQPPEMPQMPERPDFPRFPRPDFPSYQPPPIPQPYPPPGMPPDPYEFEYSNDEGELTPEQEEALRQAGALAVPMILIGGLCCGGLFLLFLVLIIVLIFAKSGKKQKQLPPGFGPR